MTFESTDLLGHLIALVSSIGWFPAFGATADVSASAILSHLSHLTLGLGDVSQQSLGILLTYPHGGSFDTVVSFLSGHSGIVDEIASAAEMPVWFGKSMQTLGLILLIVGAMAWAVSPSVRTRERGFYLVSSGFVLAIVGYGFETFQELIQYVFTG
ncbi:hypothetical protein ACFQJ5_19910 [Halomicroarcula sp. GCM10025324]|uniref:hypothetical protein n=1 Tax=Halomicroarcula sp. GCM10025324 TaxID=3252667 RepID=UPI00360F2D80